MKSIVVAYDERRGIGADNDLLWLKDLPSDLRHFKELTMGHAILMGRKTFESIGRPLPGRHNIVLTRHLFTIPGVTVVNDLNEALRIGGDDVCIIGGGEVYEQTLPYVDIIYATEVKEVFSQASVFFPKLDMDDWHEVAREEHESDERNKYAYDFVTYKRI